MSLSVKSVSVPVGRHLSSNVPPGEVEDDESAAASSSRRALAAGEHGVEERQRDASFRPRRAAAERRVSAIFRGDHAWLLLRAGHRAVEEVVGLGQRQRLLTLPFDSSKERPEPRRSTCLPLLETPVREVQPLPRVAVTRVVALRELLGELDAAAEITGRITVGDLARCRRRVCRCRGPATGRRRCNDRARTRSRRASRGKPRTSRLVRCAMKRSRVVRVGSASGSLTMRPTGGSGTSKQKKLRRR